MKKLISFVLPIFNEEKNISLVYTEIKKYFLEVEKKYNLEIIFVNDGSFDNSWLEIEKICKKDKEVKAINFSRNFGHQNAILAGLQKANGDAVITMDADLEDPVNIAFEMIKKWETGAEIVYARRKKRTGDNFFKKWTAKIYYKLLSHISSTKIPQNVADFRLLDKKVLFAFKSLREKTLFLRGMFARLGFKTEFIDFEIQKRQNGKSGYSLIKMLRLAMDGILSFSMFPLRVGFLIGVFVILVSLGFFCYIAWDYFMNGVYYELYKWISVVSFGFIGLQFIFIWIVGEYVGRVYLEVKNRPSYIISEEINFKK